MGFISNQWLKSAERFRGSGPVEVRFESEVEDPEDRDDWSERNNVTAELCARRDGGDSHILLFTTDDLRTVLPALVRRRIFKTRRGIAQDVLLAFDDAELVNFLAESLSRRTAK